MQGFHVIIVVLVIGLACASCQASNIPSNLHTNTIDLAPPDCCGVKGSVSEFLVTLLNECRAKNIELQQQLETEKKKNSKLGNASAVMDTEHFQRFWNQCNARSATIQNVQEPTTTTTTTPRPQMNTAMACEGNTLNLVCGAGTTIRIFEANYGRTEGGHVCPNNSIRTTNCSAWNSKSIVLGKCNNVASCSIPATNGVFGDPCVHTYKYLKVTYYCV